MAAATTFLLALSCAAAVGGAGGLGPDSAEFIVTDTIWADNAFGLAVGAGGYYFCYRRDAGHVARLGYLDRAGGLRTLAVPGGCQDVAVEPGDVLLVATGANRVLRVTPAGTMTVVAGSGTAPPDDPDQSEAYSIQGDGGPATNASIIPRDIATEPDGGFIVAEPFDIRRVWPDGHIMTVAGTGTGGISGDGGVATSARVYIPHGIATTPTGGIAVGQAPAEAPDVDVLSAPLGSVRYISPTGTITTIARSYNNPVAGVAVDRGGRIYVSSNGIRRVLASGRTTTVASDIDAGGADLASDAEGGLATISRYELTWIPAPRTTHLAVALNAAKGHASASGYRARPRLSTRRARMTLVVQRGRRNMASTRGLRISRHFSLGVYTVRLIARRGREVAQDAIRVVLGGYLPTSLANRAAEAEINPASASDEVDNSRARLRHCRRFGPRRYDCEKQTTDESGAPPWSCQAGLLVKLGDDGQIYTNAYECPAPRLHPRGFFGRTLSTVLGDVRDPHPVAARPWEARP